MICIVGADGFFGSYMQKHILELTEHPDLLCLNHKETVFPGTDKKTDLLFRLQDNDSIRRAARKLSEYEDIKILFFASVHNPDAVRKDPDAARYINTVCYENFLKAIGDLDIKKLIYASSDTVYGESGNGFIFTEKDAPAPVNIYGEQKLLAEEITLRYGGTAARYSYMCAPSLTERKKHFFDEVKDTLLRGDKMLMLTDWIRPALSYSTAAELTYELLTCDCKESIVNICSDSAYSKYDIGLKIAEHIGADRELIIPCTKDELNIFREKRADFIMMDNSLLKSITNKTAVNFGF